MRILLFLLIVVALGCTYPIEYPQHFPLLVADSVLDRGFGGAKFSAHFVNPVEETILSYGFEWAAPNPKNDGRIEFTGAPDGNSFSHTVTRNLESGKTIMKAFARTSRVTVYSAPMQFNSMGSDPPKIVSFTPTEGFDGTEVTLTLDNVTYDPLYVKVTLQGIPVTVLSGSDTEMKIKVPPSNLVGSARFTISDKVNNGASVDGFKVLAPAITALSKTSGRNGEKINVTGEYLTSADRISVYFGPRGQSGSREAKFTVLSATQMEIIVPEAYHPNRGVNIHVISSITGSPEKTFMYGLAFTVVD